MKNRAKNRIRLLPFLMIVALLSLFLRVNVIYHEGGDVLKGISVEAKQAVAAADKEDKKKGEKKAEKEDHGDDEHTDGDDHAKDEKKAEDTAFPEDEITDITSFTNSELDVLQSLADRRERLRARERELDQREALLRAFEDRIQDQAEALEVVQDQINTDRGVIESLVVEYQKQEEGRDKSLITTYEKMKPKDAARIFDEMEMPTLMSIIQGMKESKVAPILAAMNAEKARQVTAELARPRELPELISNSK